MSTCCLLDGETGGKFSLGPLNLGKCSSSRCPILGALKLRPFLAPWSPALSCGEHIWVPLMPRHEVPFRHMSTFCPLDGETKGNRSLDPLVLDDWSSGRCAALGALKLKPFLVPWCPALSCGEHIQVMLDTCVGEVGSLRWVNDENLILP
ncbi:hypothetical protein AAY473_011471 [Plecturocebus cupreus]